MGRPRKFDESQVVLKAAELFARQGFNGTSLDDLVATTGLQRGSIYKAFGSKLNLFKLALQRVADDFSGSPFDLDLLTVALKELSGEDETTLRICNQIVDKADSNLPLYLGQNLMNKSKGDC